MKATKTTRENIWEDGDVIEMARFQVDGANGLQADVSAIERKIFNISGVVTEIGSAVAIVVANSVFDTLQTTALDPSWTKDSTGYNFRDRIAGSNFATGGETYRVEYKFTGSGGEIFFIVFEHPAQEIHGS